MTIGNITVAAAPPDIISSQQASTIFFGAGSSAQTSQTFNVASNPFFISAYNLATGDTITVQQVFGQGSGTEVSPFAPVLGSMVLSPTLTCARIDYPGRYQLVHAGPSALGTFTVVGAAQVMSSDSLAGLAQGLAAVVSNLGTTVTGTAPIVVTPSGTTYNVSIPTYNSTSSSTTAKTSLGVGAVTTGSSSTAIGSAAVTTGAGSTAVGDTAQAIGATSTVVGTAAIADDGASVAIGNSAHTGGANSTAVGANTLTADSCTVVGEGAIALGSNAIAAGVGASAGGANTIAIGSAASAAFDNAICLGSGAGSAAGHAIVAIGVNAGLGAGFANTIVINNPSGSILNATQANQVAIGDSSVTQLVTAGSIIQGGAISASDERLKTRIETEFEALEALDKLSPVTFLWDQKAVETAKVPMNADEFGKLQHGFIAQEVEDHFPELMETIDRGAGPYKFVRYDRLVSILVAAIQELHLKVKALEEK